jgi:hypothetical protein
MKKPLFALLVMLSGSVAACSDRSVGVGSPLALRLAEDAGTTLSVSNCPDTDSPDLDRACVIDSKGKGYGVDGNLPILNAAAPYGTYLRFSTGFAPDPADVSTTGADASIKVYAADQNIQSRPCCLENDEANRIDARVATPEEGGLLVLVDHVAGTPMQVTVVFDYKLLYKSQPAHTPKGVDGFTARYYVGSTPPVVNPCPSAQTNGGSTEACDNNG